MHPGRLVSKDELMTAVWPNVVVTDDSLVQAVGDIRRALGPGAAQAIRTVPRRGYRLLAEPGSADAASAVAGTQPDAAPQPHDRRPAAVAGALSLLAVGRWDEAIAASRRAVHLSPTHPSWWLVPQIVGAIFTGRSGQALAAAQRMHAAAESPFMRGAALRLSAFALVESGRIDEARRTLAQAPPGRNAHAASAVLLLRDAAHAERYAAALVKAGLPP
jgi:Transcriptional regulatory protein, C terminal